MTLRADAALLRRVLDNLVDNAIRYAPDGSEARVTTVRRTAGVEIRDADSGPGIAPDLREKVFERFVQVDAGELTGRATNGLGLTFCKLAIEAHGGTIWVEDGGPGPSLPRAYLNEPLTRLARQPTLDGGAANPKPPLMQHPPGSTAQRGRNRTRNRHPKTRPPDVLAERHARAAACWSAE